MTFAWPVLSIQVAPDKTPFQDLGPEDWVTVGEVAEDRRYTSFSMRRGRQDQYARFEASSMTATVDISGDFDIEAGFAAFGLPMAPLRALLTYKGDEYVLWRGYLGPEPWRPEIAWHGDVATVEVEGFDRMAVFAWIKTPIWNGALFPESHGADWWLTGDVGFPVLGDGEEIPDFSGTGGVATIDAPSGKAVYFSDSITNVNISNPSMVLEEGVRVRSPEALIMPDGDEDDVTCYFFWLGNESPGGVDQEIIRQEKFGGALRWRVLCVPDGTIRLDLYDGSGTFTTSVTVTNPGGRWDDNQSHFILVRHIGGTKSELCVDGEQAYETATPLDKVRASDLVMGRDNTDQIQTFDEVVFLRHTLSDIELDAILFFVNGDVAPWTGDTFEERLYRWYKVSHFNFGAVDEAQWHNGSGTVATYWGVDNMPTDLAGALAVTADFEMGAVYCLRTGHVRARTIDALTNPAHADEYVTPAIHLTDEPSPAPSPPPAPRGGPQFSGLRLDRVINEVNTTFRSVDLRTLQETRHQVRARDQASVDRYGLRDQEFVTDVQDWATAARFGAMVVAKRKAPPVEIDAVSLTPCAEGDDSLMDWLVRDCELERAVKVTATPNVGGQYVATLNVQAEAWDWDQSANPPLRVTLNLAQS